MLISEAKKRILMKKYIVLFLIIFYEAHICTDPVNSRVLPNRSNAYVLLEPPNNVTTFKLDTSMSNAGWKNLRLCIYDSVARSAECVPDAQQNVIVHKISNLTETTSPEAPKRDLNDVAILIGTYERQIMLPATANKPAEKAYETTYVWRIDYANPQ